MASELEGRQFMFIYESWICFYYFNFDFSFIFRLTCSEILVKYKLSTFSELWLRVKYPAPNVCHARESEKMGCPNDMQPTDSLYYLAR
jgi:hypothetical protein